MADDYLNTTETTGTVTVGGSVTGNIETAGDVDWIAVTLVAGKSYRIDLKGWQTGDGTLRDPMLHGIYDADGTLVAGTRDDDGGAGFNSRLTFTATTSGTYYVAAGTYDWGITNPGTYTLSVMDLAPSAPANLAEVATTVTVDSDSAAGEIESIGNVDWFAVTLEAGKTYHIDVKGASSLTGTLNNPYLGGLYDADGTLIEDTGDDDGGLGRDSRLKFTVTESGTYYMAVGAFDSLKGTYGVSVTDVTDGIPDDYDASTETTGTVAVNGSVTGEVEEAGDVDWFAVTLEAGKTYRIDLKGLENKDGSLYDPELHGIYDADGTLIEDTGNDDSGAGRNSQLTFTATESGTYYIAAGATDSLAWPNLRGTYELSVTDLAVTDVPADLTTESATVAVGGSVTGEVETSGNVDWFKVILEAGKSYQIDVKGAVSLAGTLDNPYLGGLYTSEGTLIASTGDDDGGEGRDSRLTFTAKTSGTYYMAVGAYEDLTGTFAVSVTDVTNGFPDDYTDSTETTGTVAVGDSVMGEVEEAGDVDWFKVILEAGKSYQIDVMGRNSGDGSLYDPMLHGIYDADGNLIDDTGSDDNGEGLNGRLTFTVETAGTYYIAAGFSTSSNAITSETTGNYTVAVTDLAAATSPPAEEAGEVGANTGKSSTRGSTGDDVLRSQQASNDLLDGGAGNDNLQGRDGDDSLEGGTGDDELRGQADNDWLYGGDGNDRLNGGAGNDWLYGGNGDDRLFGGVGDDALFGDAGNDKLNGGDGEDQLQGSDGDDRLEGGAGNDWLHGGAGNDRLEGGGGDDELRGGSGDDVMEGGSGNDRLHGGDGDDVLNGGASNDWLRGGNGEDTFIFSGAFGNDKIADFTAGEDEIDLRSLETSFDEVQAKARQVAGDVQLELSNGSILLENTRLADLQAEDFLF